MLPFYFFLSSFCRSCNRCDSPSSFFFFFVSSLYILSIQSHILSALDGNASCLPIPFFYFLSLLYARSLIPPSSFTYFFFLFIPVSIFIQCPFLSFHLLLSPSSFNYPHFRFHLMPVSLIPPSPFFNSAFFFYLHIFFFFWFMPVSIFIQCLFRLLLPSSFTYPHFCFNLMPISLIPPSSFTVLTYYYFFLFSFFYIDLALFSFYNCCLYRSPSVAVSLCFFFFLFKPTISF